MHTPATARHTPALRSCAVAIIALATLSGCISLGGKPPKSLLTLTATATPATNAPPLSARISATLIVQLPTATQTLRTPRVPVQTGATDIAYLTDVQWVEPPARLFQRLLTDSIAARGRRLVLNESENITGPGELLTGELTQFGVDADRMEVVVTFNALRLMRSDGTVMQQRFEAREPIAAIDGPSVAAALNRAANRVANNVAAWADPAPNPAP